MFHVASLLSTHDLASLLSPEQGCLSASPLPVSIHDFFSSASELLARFYMAAPTDKSADILCLDPECGKWSMLANLELHLASTDSIAQD